MRVHSFLLWLPFLPLALSACGAKTGLLVPDADVPMDAPPDAFEPMDAGPDTNVCVPDGLSLIRRGAQVLFVIDRSNSMAGTLQGEEPGPGEQSRWELVAVALEEALRESDDEMEVGAEFYPQTLPDRRVTAEEACTVETGVDLIPDLNNVDSLLRFFGETSPRGGTPTAEALLEASEFYERRGRTPLPRFVVLATDGGPNCNPDTGVPADECLCTGRPEDCLAPDIGPYNCIDEARTLEVIGRLFREQEIPVYVIGIDDPGRPDLADVLDRMALAGGVPREDGPRRFYRVREPVDLRDALNRITDTISRCVFTLVPPPRAGVLDSLRVFIDSTTIARDRSRSEGWDFTAADNSEISLFGGACERATASGGEVEVVITCPDE